MAAAAKANNHANEREVRLIESSSLWVNDLRCVGESSRFLTGPQVPPILLVVRLTWKKDCPAANRGAGFCTVARSPTARPWAGVLLLCPNLVPAANVRKP